MSDEIRSLNSCGINFCAVDGYWWECGAKWGCPVEEVEDAVIRGTGCLAIFSSCFFKMALRSITQHVGSSKSMSLAQVGSMVIREMQGGQREECQFLVHCAHCHLCFIITEECDFPDPHFSKEVDVLFFQE